MFLPRIRKWVAGSIVPDERANVGFEVSMAVTINISSYKSHMV
jgi:hypothetical protein